MKICELFGQGRPILSFEIFPPKRDSGVETIYKTLDELEGLHPDFISVTYGAGGNPSDNSTLEIASAISSRYQIEPLMHLTCINSSIVQAAQMVEKLEQSGVNNVMALRGDRVPGLEPKRDFSCAADLVRFIRNHSRLGVSGACYPEGHPESSDLVTDVLHLRDKVEAGCEHLVSQLFFDNNLFYAFWERARIAGIQVPLEAGIMPVTNKKQIERLVTLCGASLPPKFAKIMQRYEHHPEALRDAGIAYAVDQIVDLVTQGVDGVHLYTMNNPLIARRISENVQSLFSLASSPSQAAAD